MTANSNNQLKVQVISVRWFLITLLCILLPKLSHAIMTVGPSNDAACDFHSLATAIANVPNEGTEVIRLVGNNGGYEVDGNVLMFNRNILLVGGYDSCSDSSTSHLNPAVISTSLSGAPNISIVGISNTFETRLTLSSVIVSGGNEDIGAGVKVTGNAHLILIGSEIKNNYASEAGGGVHVNEGKLTINYGSKISNNESLQKGGGVYCENGGEIVFFSGEVNHNESDLGAGMYLDDCTLTGTQGNGFKEISHNRGSSGIGIHAVSGSEIIMGNSDSITLFEDNRNNDFENANAKGGGALLLENRNTNAEFTNTHFVSNVANDGGAVAVQLEAHFSLKSTPNCVQDPSYEGCSSFVNNHARGNNDGGTIACEVYGGEGGAIYAYSLTRVQLDGVAVYDNKASRTGCIGNDYVRGREPRGSAFFVDNSAFYMTDSVVTGNGGSHSKSVIRNTNATVKILQTTIADNRTDVNGTLVADGDNPKFYLFGNIISEGGTDIFDYSNGPGSALIAGCNIVSRISQLTNGGVGEETIYLTTEDNPDFVNAGSRDFNLRLTSPAIDYCPVSVLEGSGFAESVAKDYNHNSRAYSLSNEYFPFDLGAMEYANGTYIGQADLNLLLSGDTHVYNGGEIRYQFDVENMGPYTAKEVKLKIYLDDNTATQWVDIVPENPADWSCVINNKVISCDVNGLVATSRHVSSLEVYVSADVDESLVEVSAELTDNKTFDMNYQNSVKDLQTSVSGIDDTIFASSFD